MSGAERSWVTRSALITLSLLTLISAYLFSRFTVDDAFITWRYGAQWVASGLWAYNPGEVDLTQAYTNPIYALLSVIPALLGIDVTLFFKLLSIMTLLGFIYALARVSERRALGATLALCLFATPTAMIHMFSGLETGLYAGLLGLLWISLERDRPLAACLLSALLVITRPEAWLCLGYTPLLIWLSRDRLAARGATRRAYVGVGILCVVAFMYFVSHRLHFGDWLPNTFYVKRGDHLSLSTLIKMSLACSALLPALILSRSVVPLVALASSLILSVKYASSTLTMNYASRFLFHVFAPLYLLSLYHVARVISSPDERSRLHALCVGRAAFVLRGERVWLTSILIMTLAGFTLITTHKSTLVTLMNYTPRLLESHARLGVALSDLEARGERAAFAFGDAGLAAYLSRARSFDPQGLCSRAVAREGLTERVIGLYRPDVVVSPFTTRAPRRVEAPQAKLQPKQSAYTSALLSYVEREGLTAVCDLAWKPDATFRVFARPSMSHDELKSACKMSSGNTRDEDTLLRAHWLEPPWRYWRSTPLD